MTDNLLILPIFAHLLTAILLIFAWSHINLQRVISLFGHFMALVLSLHLFSKTWKAGILTMQAGGWKAPFGITFVSDTFSATFVVLTAIAGLAVGIFSTVSVTKARMQFGYFAISHFLMMGLNGAFLTGDIFNLYVWFEIVIISSFVLMTLAGKKPQMEGAIKYVAMNMLASTVFLTAIAILYGLTGTLNMADLSLKVAQIEKKELVSVTSLLFFVGFGIKSAVFPLYFWLPSSYHTPPSAIAATFGGLLTKMGVYAMMRTFTLVFVPDAFTQHVLIACAILTLFTGAMGALNKTSIRRMFSYLIICHIGFMIGGLGLHTHVALAAVVFYLIHDIIVKTNLFLATGIIHKIRGSTDIRRLGGLYEEYPKLSLLMAIIFFSMVGIPPLSGFWPKIGLFQSSLDQRSYILLAAFILASFFTLYIIAKMWSEVFWKDLPKRPEETNEFTELPFFKQTLLIVPVVGLALVSLYIGLGAENIMIISNRIATNMIDTGYYLDAVLNK
ncbi:MAG: Na+/H+ antiporter subunit D [Cytophagaceae bacterium SCN 52-12]|nr:MAG: Na+/H+ antiporter subunit D [Cytophagaceae bacterium SCN 52-12]